MKESIIKISLLFFAMSCAGYLIWGFIENLIYDTFEILIPTIVLDYITTNLISTILGARLMQKKFIDTIKCFKIKSLLLFIVNWMLSLLYFSVFHIIWLANVLSVF